MRSHLKLLNRKLVGARGHTWKVLILTGVCFLLHLVIIFFQSDLKDKKKKGRRMGKKSKAALLVSKSCYKAAFKMLWSAKGARKPMMEFWSKQLKEEVRVEALLLLV